MGPGPKVIAQIASTAALVPDELHIWFSASIAPQVSNAAVVVLLFAPFKAGVPAVGEQAWPNAEPAKAKPATTIEQLKIFFILSLQCESQSILSVVSCQ
jgi:hypothetical protein